MHKRVLQVIYENLDIGYTVLYENRREKNRGRTNCYSQLHQNQQPAFKEFSSAFYLITYLMGYETLYKSQHFLAISLLSNTKRVRSY